MTGRLRPTLSSLGSAILLLAALHALSGVARADTGPCNAPTLPLTGTRIVHVSTEPQLQSAVANVQAGDTIVIAPGAYALTSTLYLNGKPNVTIRGDDGCDAVVLSGKGMDNPSYGNVPFGIWSNSLNTTVAHLTIRNTWDNLLIFNAGAQAPHVYGVKLLDAGSQFIKANPTDAANAVGVDNGVVEYSWLEYTAGPPATDHGAGAGYTNGISAHAADGWVIRKNLFKRFHTPDSAAYLWNPAVLMWNHSSNTLTEQNAFIDVDRAIAYGLVTQATGHDHQGGTIRNNFVYMTPGLYSANRRAGSDGQIIVWDSPQSRVYHNTVLTNGNTASSIEFRFAGSAAGEIRNNLADARINFRDGASATQSGNFLGATPAMFANPAAGDLHLVATASQAIDQAPALAAVTDDFDGDSRPQGVAADIGADEFRSGGPPAVTTSLAISAPTVTAPADARVAITVTATAGTPTGSVSLSLDGGTPRTAALSGGTATFSIPSPSAGAHALVGSYAAQNGFGASSATGTLQVKPGSGGAITTVDFDNPAPPGAPGSRLGQFGGINWAKLWCWWGPRAGVDATNSAGACKAGGLGGRVFSFSPGPRTLVSVTLVSGAAGAVTISDNTGQRATATLVPGQSAIVTTGWTRPSAWVLVSSPAGAAMRITALQHR